MLASAALGGALAQEPELDLEAIRARAAEQAGDAEALAAAARERAKAVADAAVASTEQGRANGRRYAARGRASAPADPSVTFDFDSMVADAGAIAEVDLGEAPRFIAFASTSMPAAALRTMIADVTRAGGVVVFRGFPRGNAKAFTAALGQALKPGEKVGNVGIDPRLFRAFRIDAVPAYVVAGSDFDLCDGFDCSTAVPPFDLMTGNVTAAHALETFVSGGGPGARIAVQYLARLQQPDTERHQP